MKYLLIISLCIFSLSLSAQNNDWPKFCGTDSLWKEAVKRDPSAAKRRQELQNFTKLFKSNQQKSTLTDTVLFSIPVVFHVIHTYGNENISKDQIVDAVNILNLSFQKLNDDTNDVIPLFQPIFANCQIRFRLANIDPQGNCTDGITRTFSPLTAIASDNVKALVDWPSDQYLNIWVVKNIASGAAGYAYYPGISASADGVVILHDYVGSIGTSNGSNYSSRSLTHEVGHWLNLPHTWGGTNTPGLPSNCGIDDGISDTPNTIGVNNFSCNTAQNSCGQIDNVQNYMDYASCHKMFTEEQKYTMQAALNSSVGNRDVLWDVSTLTATGTEDGHITNPCAPIADLSSTLSAICEGGSLNFKDFSWNGDITSRVWNFPGGIPSTDTSATPTIVYPTTGTYDVTLTVTNSIGSSTITRVGLVNVTPPVANIMAPTTESFESLTIPGNDWVIQNAGNNNTWEITNLAAVTGSKSARILNYNGNVAGVDELISAPYNLTNITGAQLTFKLAFAPKSSVDNSSLTIFVSNDCGNSWSQRYQKTGSFLQTTANPIFPTFVPNATQWRTETIALSNGIFGGKPSVRFRFQFKNDNGNNIYIDDINITGLVGINEILASKFSFVAWPNPANSVLNIKLDRTDAMSVVLELYDALGRKISTSEPSSISKGIFEYSFVNKNYSGVYTLRIKAGDNVFQQKVMFVN